MIVADFRNNRSMNKMTVTKVRTGQENTNPATTTLVYREKSYPAREIRTLPDEELDEMIYS